MRSSPFLAAAKRLPQLLTGGTQASPPRGGLAAVKGRDAPRYAIAGRESKCSSDATY